MNIPFYLRLYYIRKKGYGIKGCVAKIRYAEDEEWIYGWSLCHPLDMKKSTKKLARTIAIGRALRSPLPQSQVAEERLVRLSSGAHTYMSFNGEGDVNVAVPETILRLIKKDIEANATRQMSTNPAG